MCRKVVSVAMLLLASWVSCWGEVRPSGSIDQRSSNSRPLSQSPSTLWQIADDSLTIIEESLIAQSEPVESLSASLLELYQKSQELQESVNALSQRFESFERFLAKLEKVLTQAVDNSNTAGIKMTIWKTLAIIGISGSVFSMFVFTFRQ